MLGPCLRHDEPPGVSLCIFPIKALDGDCHYISRPVGNRPEFLHRSPFRFLFLLNKETRSMAVEREE